MWCMTSKEFCFTHRSLCVGKLQLQHHVSGVVAAVVGILTGEGMSESFLMQK